MQPATEDTEDAIGGLYTPVIFKPFLLGPDMQEALFERLTRPRPWHGAPFAALKKAFASLGSVRIKQFINRETFKDLQLLHQMYFWPENGTDLPIRPPPSLDRRPPNDFEDDEDSHPSKKSSIKKRVPEQTLGGRGKFRKIGERESGETGETEETRETEKTGETGETEKTEVTGETEITGETEETAMTEMTGEIGETGYTGYTGGAKEGQMPAQDPVWTLGPNSTSASCMDKYGPMLLRKVGVY
jgi:hypothetical protein